jgi:hypothetical protein
MKPSKISAIMYLASFSHRLAMRRDSLSLPINDSTTLRIRVSLSLRCRMSVVVPHFSIATRAGAESYSFLLSPPRITGVVSSVCWRLIRRPAAVPVSSPYTEELVDSRLDRRTTALAQNVDLVHHLLILSPYTCALSRFRHQINSPARRHFRNRFGK